MRRKDFERLTVVFAPIINKYIYKFNLPSMDHDDLRQEAITALWKALPSFDSSRGNVHSFVKSVVIRHINMVASNQLQPKRHWPAMASSEEQTEKEQQDEDVVRDEDSSFNRYLFQKRPSSQIESIIDSSSIPDEYINVDLSLPNFDANAVSKRNLVNISDRNPNEKTSMKRNNCIHYSDHPHDLDFVQQIIKDGNLEQEPIDKYWEISNYWVEDAKYKRIVERYPWGQVIFISNKIADEHATIVFEEIKEQHYCAAILEADIVPWYKELEEYFIGFTPEKPNCFSHYISDPVCDGGYNSRTRLMEKSCLWCDECRSNREAPEKMTLEQLAEKLCQAISDVSGIPITSEPERSMFHISTIQSKAESGLYLNYQKSNDAKFGVMIIKYKKRNLSVGLACEVGDNQQLKKANWGHYKSAIKKLQSEAQFQAIIETACKIVEELD